MDTTMYFRMVVSETCSEFEYTKAILTIRFTTSSSSFVYLVDFVIFKL